MKNMSLNNLIITRVAPALDRVALIGNNQRISFQDLLGTCSGLQGKRVAVFVRNTIGLVRTLVALDGCAKTICPISTATDTKEIHHIIAKHPFDVVITDMSTRPLQPFSDLDIQIQNLHDVCFLDSFSESQNNQQSDWLVPTSGTTSMPKLVSHSISSLGASSLKMRKLTEQNKIWAQFYDLTRFAGYQVLLNSLLNGHTLVTLPAEISIHERVERCAEECVTHISATPSQWRKILMTGEDAKRIPLEQIVLGGEAVDQQILTALSNSYPKAKITHTYASTEAGLGIAVSDRLAGFPLRFIGNTDGSADISVRSGKLFLKAPSSASGYVDGKLFKDLEGWIDTGDLVEFVGDRFIITGRESGIINVGGDKVNPETVRQTLLEHPDVLQAIVFGRKNPITGMVLSAKIQIKANVDEMAAKTSIKIFIKENLPTKERPRLLNFVDDIGVTLTGKMRSET